MTTIPIQEVGEGLTTGRIVVAAVLLAIAIGLRVAAHLLDRHIRNICGGRLLPYNKDRHAPLDPR